MSPSIAKNCLPDIKLAFYDVIRSSFMHNSDATIHFRMGVKLVQEEDIFGENDDFRWGAASTGRYWGNEHFCLMLE